MTFGEFVKHRRLELKKTQSDLQGFGQTYISEIEIGRKRPTKRETIVALATALQLPDNQVDWLWAYSLFNRDPNLYFGRLALGAGNAAAIETAKTREIAAGATLADVRAQLGEPDEIVKFGDQQKWRYAEKGIAVLFEAGQVVDVVFK